MKFNEKTVEVLKNFSNINQGIMLRKGDTLKTISNERNMLAVATLDQSIDGNAGIYDLSRFLATHDIMNGPDVEFKKDRFVMKNGTSQVNYTYAAEAMLVLPPENKEIPLNDVKSTFFMPWQTIQSLIKAGGVLNLSDIHISAKETGPITISAEDKSNPTADTFKIDIETDEEHSAFSVYLKLESFKLLPMDYMVHVTDRVVSFKNKRIQYWLVTEA